MRNPYTLLIYYFVLHNDLSWHSELPPPIKHVIRYNDNFDLQIGVCTINYIFLPSEVYDNHQC